MWGDLPVGSYGLYKVSEQQGVFNEAKSRLFQSFSILGKSWQGQSQSLGGIEKIIDGFLRENKFSSRNTD